MPSLAQLSDLIHSFHPAAIELIRELIETIDGLPEEQKRVVIAVIVTILRLTPADRVALYPRWGRDPDV